MRNHYTCNTCFIKDSYTEYIKKSYKIIRQWWATQYKHRWNTKRVLLKKRYSSGQYSYEMVDLDIYALSLLCLSVSLIKNDNLQLG